MISLSTTLNDTPLSIPPEHKAFRARYEISFNKLDESTLIALSLFYNIK